MVHNAKILQCSVQVWTEEPTLIYISIDVLESNTETLPENKNVVLYGATCVEIRTRTPHGQREMPDRNKNVTNKNWCSVWGSQ